MQQPSTVSRLLNKAKEAFILAIETYNKPTLRYRLEAFSFLMCNAWELMLKAHIINKSGEDSIYYKDNPKRTISLEKCLQLVFTNDKSPLRLNMAKIIQLRNTSTHFITEEYEMVYVPLLQACTFNFVDKIREFHNIDMTEIIPENFITLSVRFDILDESEIRGKYPRQISEKLINDSNAIMELSNKSNDNFAIRIRHDHYNVKRKEEAGEFYHIARSAEEGVRIIKQIQDPNDIYKYTQKHCIEEIKKLLNKREIKLKMNGSEVIFNKYHFQLMIGYYSIKEKNNLCFKHKVPKVAYTYSYRAIEFIFQELLKDPEHILDNIKASLNKERS